MSDIGSVGTSDLPNNLSLTRISSNLLVRYCTVLVGSEAEPFIAFLEYNLPEPSEKHVPDRLHQAIVSR